MSHTLIIADGGVPALLAIAAASERLHLQGSGPGGVLSYVWCPDTGGPEISCREAASQIQSDFYGISRLPKQIPIWGDPEGSGSELRILLEGALLVQQLGGGEVIWPVAATEAAGGGPDVNHMSRTINQSLLISQLVSLGGPRRPAGQDLSGAVRIRTPYADLVDRQVADLILDMDLPVWTCWFWGAAEQADDHVRAEALLERERWMAVLRQAGWTGSFDAVKPNIVVRPSGIAPERGPAGGSS